MIAYIQGQEQTYFEKRAGNYGHSFWECKIYLHTWNCKIYLHTWNFGCNQLQFMPAIASKL